MANKIDEATLAESLGYLARRGQVNITKANDLYVVEFTPYHNIELTYVNLTGHDKKLSDAANRVVVNFLNLVQLIRDGDY